MEKGRKGRMDILKSRLMSSNDHVRNYFLREKHVKENILKQNGQRMEEIKKGARSPTKPQDIFKTSKSEREKHEEKRPKSPQKNLIYLELKPFRKNKTNKQSTESQPETKKIQKTLERLKTKEAGSLHPDASLVDRKLQSFHNTWEHTNFSVVPTLSANRTRDSTRKERKRKHSERNRKKNDSSHRTAESKVENQKNMELVMGENKKNKKLEVLYSPFKSFMSGRQKYLNETGGEAVVIYHRHNKSNYLHPQTGDGYQFEQISFSGSCETAVDLVQSKRSLSEPRQNSTKEFYVARRRTRFQLDPHKRPSTQSDFHSAIDFLKQSSASVEFQNFEGMSSSVTKFVYKNPLHDFQKWDEKKTSKHSTHPVTKKSKSSTNSSAMMGIRLKQTAEKKLDLHREMIRAEHISKKKFWESIERSLNYRCAVAEMFSSQSYISSNESSKFFRSSENPVGRSTNIFVRESVIEEISSYQGFSRTFSSIFSSNEPDIRAQSTPQNVSQPSNSAFCQMKAVLDTFLIKEDEEVEEEIYLKQRFEDRFISQSSSQSIVETDISPFDINDSIFSHSTSEKLTLMESNLCNSDTHSKLELLMSKLSEEIRKCSDFMKKFYEQKTDKFRMSSSVKLSASDSKIELNNDPGNKMSKKSLNSYGWTSSEPVVYPIFAYSTGKISLDDDNTLNPSPKKQNNYKESEKEEINLIQKIASKDLNIVDPLPGQSSKREVNMGSKDSIFSCRSVSSTETPQMSQSTKKVKNILKEFACCDDCKLLKRRIVKLEKELEKIEKRMPLYPKEYQESIKDCLESLNVTSETFLKRLRSCAKLRYFDSKSRKICKNDSKRSTSAPGPIIHKCSKKKLGLRPSNSDYQLNVGMEITMENVDPATGEKLCPETNEDTKQEGNIQCRMFKDGEKPVLVMDTDFCYNPATGMLFKKKGSHSTKSPSTDLIIPMDSVIKKAPSAMNLMRNFGKLETYECTDIKSKPLEPELVRPKTPKNSQRDLVSQVIISPMADAEVMADVLPRLLSNRKSKSKESTEMESTIETGTSPKSRLSLNDMCNLKENLNRNRSASRESKKKMHNPRYARKKSEKSEKLFSRIPIRRKPTPSSARSKADSVSLQNSMTSIFNIPEQLKCYPTSSATSGIILLKLAKLFSFTWTFGFFLCKLVHYMQSVSAICSILTLTAMSLERYYAIVHPMKAQYICTISQARRIITATWISAFLLAVPILFAQVHLKVGVKVEAYWCVRDWDNKTIWRVHELYMMLLILIVPTGVMAVAYTAICLEIWEVIQRRQDLTSGKGHDICRRPKLARNSTNNSLESSFYKNTTLESKRSRGLLKKEMADDAASIKQVIKMLVAVVVIYVICWGPMLIDNVLQAYEILSHIRMGWLKYMGTTFHLMAYFNSCINPIVYGFMSKNFQESFRKTLCCLRKKPKTAYRNFSLSQTRNASTRYAESSFSRTISIALPV